MSVIILKSKIYSALPSYVYVASMQRTYRWMNNITNRGGGSLQQGETIVRQSKTYWSSTLFLLCIYNRTRKEKKKECKESILSLLHFHLYIDKYLSFTVLWRITFVIVQEYSYCSVIYSIDIKTIVYNKCTDLNYEKT
jgi:hypothetical protein